MGNRRRTGDRLDGTRMLFPGRDRGAPHRRWAVEVSQRQGAEGERKIGQSPECPLYTDAYVRRAGGMLQPWEAEKKRRIDWMEEARQYELRLRCLSPADAVSC